MYGPSQPSLHTVGISPIAKQRAGGRNFAAVRRRQRAKAGSETRNHARRPFWRQPRSLITGVFLWPSEWSCDLDRRRRARRVASLAEDMVARPGLTPHARGHHSGQGIAKEKYCFARWLRTDKKTAHISRHCVRAAKEMDSKSIGLCPQGFESPRCRLHSSPVLEPRQEEWFRNTGILAKRNFDVSTLAMSVLDFRSFTIIERQRVIWAAFAGALDLWPSEKTPSCCCATSRI